ncbi:MAG: AAA family ATPase [Syntrophales bacterium]|jgi:general secretion pathway protein A|nr:AAA family ATPase [Syntrophales bacterium]
MDYFKILNLNREPFSNSPDPGLFFQSPGQLTCLQQLELSIRLRRGLNVVIGEVGTGKSTLCRQLIIRLSESEGEQREIETSLIMDPAISTPREFLSVVSVCFGLKPPLKMASEWQIKEKIKETIYQKGVEEKKIIVLIIDEGQKIPVFALEILREFLNYETNESKLLQIVIFAQNEFKEIMYDHKNFLDRVNGYYMLTPLNFRETKGMIEFRLQQAAHPAQVPKLFTKPSYWAIYGATGGYPRRIVTLCHHLLLAMIIKNRIKVNWFLVRVTVGRDLPENTVKGVWTKTSTFLGAFLLLLLIVLFFFTRI